MILSPIPLLVMETWRHSAVQCTVCCLLKSDMSYICNSWPLGNSWWVFDETNLSCYSKYKLWDNCFIYCNSWPSKCTRYKNLCNFLGWYEIQQISAVEQLKCRKVKMFKISDINTCKVTRGPQKNVSKFHSGAQRRSHPNSIFTENLFSLSHFCLKSVVNFS